MRTVNNMTFKIAGEAGQGVESSGAGFGPALARAGLHVFAMQDYRSRIRGGHNFYQIRVSEQTRLSHVSALCHTDLGSTRGPEIRERLRRAARNLAYPAR